MDRTKPEITIPAGEAPGKALLTDDLEVGSGDTAQPGHQVEVHYVGVAWSTGEQFDASWDRGREPFTFELGAGGVIPGWDEGLVGMREGGRRLLVIPAAKGYGPQGQPPDIGPNETLIFVVDLKKIA